jgi:hypothetical protein
MKNANGLLLFVCASALLLTACASQNPVRQVAAAPAVAGTTVPAANSPSVAATPASTAATSKSTNGTQAVTVVGNRYSGTRRVFKDGVEYFCERPAPTGSHFIAQREQCYTAAQLKAVRERDQDFVHRQQELALQTDTKSVTRTPMGK